MQRGAVLSVSQCAVPVCLKLQMSWGNEDTCEVFLPCGYMCVFSMILLWQNSSHNACNGMDVPLLYNKKQNNSTYNLQQNCSHIDFFNPLTCICHFYSFSTCKPIFFVPFPQKQCCVMIPPISSYKQATLNGGGGSFQQFRAWYK